MLQELGWIVQPNLSFGVTLGCPENPGRTRSGSKEGCLGWWHGRERSLEKPLSSLVVEESLRTAQVPAWLRSRKLGCESQSCSPGVSVAIWDDLGKSHSSRTGRDSTSPAGGEDVPAGISFPHRIPSLPTLLLPGCPPGAASFPLHSQIIPFRRSARRNPSHNTHGDPTAHPCSASMHRGILPTKKKNTLGKRPKSLGGRTVGFALLISDLKWARIKTQQGKAEFPARASNTPSIPSPTTRSAMPTLPIPSVFPQALTGMTLGILESLKAAEQCLCSDEVQSMPTGGLGRQSWPRVWAVPEPRHRR